ncbi:MAG: TIGR01841 family phasin [Maricaulaceae bacterium]|jgi:phasin family protein
MASKAKTAKPAQAAATAAQTAQKTAAEGFAKATSAFSEMGVMSKDNLDAFVKSASTASKTAEEINARVASYTKQAWETNVASAKKIAAAKSVQEVVELQSEAARDAFNAYLGQCNEIADIYAAALKDSLEPINKRVTAATEAFRI